MRVIVKAQLLVNHLEPPEWTADCQPERTAMPLKDFLIIKDCCQGDDIVHSLKDVVNEGSISGDTSTRRTS